MSKLNSNTSSEMEAINFAQVGRKPCII